MAEVAMLRTLAILALIAVVSITAARATWSAATTYYAVQHVTREE